MKKKALLVSVAVLLGLGAAIQLVPVELDNPPVEQDISAPAEVKAILKRSCYDCHSNETVWPWYSRVAPVSWLVASDVEEGRDRLNFSTWGTYDSEQQKEAIHDAAEEVEKGEMPMWIYTVNHPEARLSAEDKAVLKAWAGGQ